MPEDRNSAVMAAALDLENHLFRAGDDLIGRLRLHRVPCDARHSFVRWFRLSFCERGWGSGLCDVVAEEDVAILGKLGMEGDLIDETVRGEPRVPRTDLGIV